MEEERIPPPPAGIEPWSPTPTAASVSEIKYLYLHACLLWETSDVKSSNDALQDTALKMAILILGNCRFDPKLVKFSKNGTVRSDRYSRLSR